MRRMIFGFTQIVAKTKKNIFNAGSAPQSPAKRASQPVHGSRGATIAKIRWLAKRACIPDAPHQQQAKHSSSPRPRLLAESTAIHLHRTQRDPEEATKMTPPKLRAQLRNCAPPAQPTGARTAQCPYFETGRVSNGADGSTQHAIYVNLMFWT